MIRLLTHALLLIAVILSGSVPEGMMRAGGAEGMRLVLCTPQGTQEVWLTDAGEVVPVEDQQDHDRPHCVQVTVADAGVLPPLPDLLRMLRPAPPLDTSHTLPSSPPATSVNRARAPPLLA